MTNKESISVFISSIKTSRAASNWVAMLTILCLVWGMFYLGHVCLGTIYAWVFVPSLITSVAILTRVVLWWLFREHVNGGANVKR